MKFNKNKCQIVHLGRGNPGYPYRLGDKRLESCPTERDLGVLANRKLNTSQKQHALAAKNVNWIFGVHQAWYHLPVRDDHPALLCTGVVSPQALCAVLGATIWEGHKAIRVSKGGLQRW